MSRIVVFFDDHWKHPGSKAGTLQSDCKDLLTSAKSDLKSGCFRNLQELDDSRGHFLCPPIRSVFPQRLKLCSDSTVNLAMSDQEQVLGAATLLAIERMEKLTKQNKENKENKVEKNKKLADLLTSR